MSDKALTPKQRRFVQEYLIDLNATQAAIRAGYSVNAAAEIGHENLRKPHIAKHIEQVQAERATDTAWDAKKVRERLEAYADLDVADILNDEGACLPIKQWPKMWRLSLSGMGVMEITSGGDVMGVIKKIKWPDRHKSIELLGRHVDIRAFSEKQETDTNVEPVTSITYVEEDASNP